MKPFLLLFVMIPLLGIAQPEKIAGQPHQQGMLTIPNSMDWKGVAQQLANSNDYNWMGTTGLNTNTSNRMLEDSSHFTSYISGISMDSSYSRIYYDYDSIGNLSTEYNYSTQPYSSKAKISKTKYEFDANGHMALIAKYEYINGQYSLVDKTEYQYDLTGKLKHQSRIISIVNESEELVNYLKEVWNNDENMQIYIRSLWDTNKNEWASNYKTTYTYDENGKEVESESFSYYNNKWVGQQKLEISYENKNITLQLLSKWDDVSGRWEKSQKLEYAYNQSGKQIHKIISFWNNIKNQWVENEKEERSYTPSGKIYTVSNFKSDTTVLWIGVEKEEYSYNAHEDVVARQIFIWDDQENQWSNQAKYDYNYNTKNQIVLYTYSQWDYTSEQWIPSSITDCYYGPGNYSVIRYTKPWNSTSDQLIMESKEEHFYSSHTFSDVITEPESELLTIFPNPFHEFFFIKNNDTTITQCQLFNSNGQLIETLPVMQGITKYIFHDLNVGLYLIKIKTGQGIRVKKIIKR